MAENVVFSLAKKLVGRCVSKNVSLCTAESCTGGMIAESITAVSGASAVFLGALVTYDERMMAKWLGVSEETLSSFGAVSEACAREMAEGARRASGAALALSVTGFAGPAGGTAKDPVGTVYLAVSSASGTVAYRQRFSGGRDAVRTAAVEEALRHLLSAAESI